MIAVAARPYFAPHPAFLARIQAADIFVILDTVQFPRGFTWLTRNRLKNHQGTLWLTLPVWRRSQGLQTIEQVRLCHEGNWAGKHLQSIREAYRHAPFFAAHEDFITALFNAGHEHLLTLNLALLDHLLDSLAITTPQVRLSRLGITSRGPDLLPAVCRAVEADTLLCPPSIAGGSEGRQLSAAGIRLLPFRAPRLVYPQLWGNFVPDCSTLDLLFTCGPAAGDLLFPVVNRLVKKS